MLFYVPPLSPVMAGKEGDSVYHLSGNLFHDIDESRIPIEFLASLLGAGNEALVRYALRKQKAIRLYRRALTVGDVDDETARRALLEADCTAEEAEAIYRLTSLCTFEDRFVIPPMHREEAIENARGAPRSPAERGVRVQSGAPEGPVTADGGILEEPRRSLPLPRTSTTWPACDAAGIGRRAERSSKEAAKGLERLAAALSAKRVWEIEELYTRAFDLNPICALEVGWHLYGEQYERGRFLVRSRDLLASLDIDEAGELPDHLSSMLIALGRLEPEPAAAFAARFLVPALRRMADVGGAR